MPTNDIYEFDENIDTPEELNSVYIKYVEAISKNKNNDATMMHTELCSLFTKYKNFMKKINGDENDNNSNCDDGNNEEYEKEIHRIISGAYKGKDDKIKKYIEIVKIRCSHDHHLSYLRNGWCAGNEKHADATIEFENLSIEIIFASGHDDKTDYGFENYRHFHINKNKIREENFAQDISDCVTKEVDKMDDFSEKQKKVLAKCIVKICIDLYNHTNSLM